MQCFRRLTHPAVLLTVLAGFLVDAARADIAPDPLSGGESFGSPGRSATIAMAEETVQLTIGCSECRTKAVFLMKNLSDQPVEMRVGFPVFHTTDLLDFRASVEGKPVEVTGHPMTRRGRGWKLWKMTFSASSTTRVEVSYRHKLKSQYSWGVGVMYGDLGRHVREAATPEELAPLQGRFVKNDVYYILRTGRNWAGPIGRCRIEVGFADGLTLENVVLYLPRAISGLPPKKQRVPEEERITADPKTTKDSIVWELRDFEPDRNIALQVAGVTRKETRELLETIHKRDPFDPAIGRYLGEYRLAAGDSNARHEMNEKILRSWQDRIAIWGPESEDRVKLRHSREVFSLMRNVTGSSSKTMVPPNPQQVEPVIRKIALRLQEQMKLAEPNSRTVKLYRTQVEATLKWCDQHAKK
jgi:hypothetical protein